jgi:hypothetical protein
MKYNKTGVLLAEDSVVKERLDICFSCKFLKENTCMACGCNIFVKTNAKIDECPKGYWKL